MTTILAIDPCAEREVSNTGWAYGRFDDNTPYEFLAGGVVEGGFGGLSQALQPGTPVHSRWGQFRDFLVANADIVVVEHFIHYNRAGDATPLLAEGVVRHLRPDAVLQPSSALQYVTDGQLKALGLYVTLGHHKDRNSAVKHALAYLRNQYHRPTLQALTFSRKY